MQRTRSLAAFSLLLLLCGHYPLRAQDDSRQATARARSVDVVHYDVEIEPDLARRSVSGKVVVRFVTHADAVASVAFDCGDLTVDSVRSRGRQLIFRQQDHRLVVALRTPANANETQSIEIQYHGSPQRGLSFFVDPGQIYTAFSTSQWMVCVDAPDNKATIRLALIVPASWVVVANGHLVQKRSLSNDRMLHQFRQDRPVPSYTFGFAAGRFQTIVEKSGTVQLRYMASGMPEGEVRRVFRDTSDMLAFFQLRAGLKYLDSSYTQVLATGTPQQEMTGFSLLPDSYAAWVLQHDQDVTLGAHELAHQWWGNRVTCRDWTHFWLNEGTATFMAAAYIEHRFGRAEYLRLIEEYRLSYERVRAGGKDKPLVFQDWVRPTVDDRTLVYRKGAFVLHLLREELGDDAFWAGVRAYTRMYDGQSVTTADFQAAMERTAGRSLSGFFSQWVYGTQP